MKQGFILPRIRHIFILKAFLVVGLLLTACGNDTDAEPTAAPTEPPATPTEGQMTVGDLVSLSDESWGDVTFMRTTSQSGSIPTDDESEPFTGSVQDWTPNGNRHLLEFQSGTMINEQIWADGVVYMRGQFVSSAVAPELDVNTWITLDTEVVQPNTPVGIQVDYLIRDQHGAYGELSDDFLAQPVTEGGQVTVGDRSCTLYTFGDENDTGTEIRYEITVDDDGHPCQVIQRAGDFQNSTVYVFNLDEEIEAPLEGTPVSGTPEG